MPMSNKKYHYVYRITNKEINKHYYGCRTSTIHPSLDLGVCYYSSSKDSEFLKEQRESSVKFKYKIIRIFNDRKSALKFEIYLHNRFNVATNNAFYNNAKQTNTGFDTTGVSSPQKGISSYMVKDKFGKTLKVSEKEYLTGDYSGQTKGKCKVTYNGKSILVDRDEYIKNKDKYGHHIRGKVSAININTGETLLVSKDEFETNKELRGASYGNMVCINKKTNERVYISKLEYNTNRELYRHLNEGTKASIETRRKLSEQRKGMLTIKNFNGEYKRIHKNDLYKYPEWQPHTSRKYIIISPNGNEYKILNISKFLKDNNLPRDTISCKHSILDENGVITNFPKTKHVSPIGWKFVYLK